MGGEPAVEHCGVFAHRRIDARAVAAERFVELAQALARGRVELFVVRGEPAVDLLKAPLGRIFDPIRVFAHGSLEGA